MRIRPAPLRGRPGKPALHLPPREADDKTRMVCSKPAAQAFQKHPPRRVFMRPRMQAGKDIRLIRTGQRHSSVLFQQDRDEIPITVPKWGV